MNFIYKLLGVSNYIEELEHRNDCLTKTKTELTSKINSLEQLNKEYSETIEILHTKEQTFNKFKNIVNDISTDLVNILYNYD